MSATHHRLHVGCAVPRSTVRAAVLGIIFILQLQGGLTGLGAGSSTSERYLSWGAGIGVVWRTPWAEVRLDHGASQRGPILLFLKDAREAPLENPGIERSGPDAMTLKYEAITPGGGRLLVSRHLQIQRARAGWTFVEDFELKPSALVEQDLEIVRPFSVRSVRRSLPPSEGATCVLPLKNGWARRCALSDPPVTAEYRLGHWIRGNETPELALPVVQVDPNREWQMAVCLDPRFSGLFTLSDKADEVSGEVRYRYAGSKVPIAGVEARKFGFWVRAAPPSSEPFGASLDAFFRLMLSDVPPGPKWLHEICMVDYDFLSDNGQGWERDVSLLAGWLKPRERKHVALCLHGWYDALGSYSFDSSSGRMKDHWTAMARTRKVDFTPEELRRRLRLARDRGFRVLLYFGDGLAADSGVQGYHGEWVFRDESGKAISGWQGPDTFGPTYMMNPAHPEVQRNFLGYLDALLGAVGRDVDGFVWDETFHARAGQIATAPRPAYCDRAMLDLVKGLTARVRAFDAQKVFLASDCIGIAPGIPGYAMVASGTYQDTHCAPERWSDALFPNWRNTYWSCNWGPVSHFDWTRFGIEEFGAPVAISNGWEEDHGPHEWNLAERDMFLALFRQRMARGPGHVRYLTEDPSGLIERRSPDHAPAPSDPVPRPAAGEANWALAANGAIARASSENRDGARHYPAQGAIDGGAGENGWGHGHGWASAAGAALPQWIEIEFSEPHPVSRFVITTYQAAGDSARRWGVADYSIEVWDGGTDQWRTVVTEQRPEVRFIRVHQLAVPVRAKKFRVTVRRVVPSGGGIARLLQVQAWGLRQ